MELVVGILALLVAIFSLVASYTGLLRPVVPVDSGFLVDGEVRKSLAVSTGDPAKKLVLRFQNRSGFSLTGIIVDIRFMNPIALSGTGSAVMLIEGQTAHGRMPDESYYLVSYSGLMLLGDQSFDVPVEINTEGKVPGTYYVEIRVDSTKGEHKGARQRLSLSVA